MRRRQLLAAAPAVVALGGCAGAPAATAAGTSSSQSESAMANRETVSISVRSTIRYLTGMDSMTVTTPDRAQFAFVEAPDSEVDRPPEAFELALGDRRFSPRSSVPGRGLAVTDVGDAYTNDQRWGWLVFDVPTVDADSTVLVRDGAHFPLSDESLPLFSATADLRLRSVSVPDAVAADKAVRVGVTVENRGDRDGLFMAVAQEPGLPTRVDVAVPAGETREKDARLAVWEEPGETKAFKFVHAGGSTRYDVAVESE